ncbi:MAG: division/cell wall cluster transcriptional repressor MraZ [Clostridia bacterium]|nr:division/cell wall cluster transcriptional repressor MraZ [Clostridia bacterium]
MRGEYQHNIDSKGRLIFPVKLREELGENFVIFRGLDNCIYVYSQEQWKSFEEKLSALPASKGRQLRRFFSANFVCEPDGQGRILIPQVLREHAGLQKDVTVIGVMDHVEIWDSAAWKKYNDETDDDEIAAMMETMDV